MFCTSCGSEVAEGAAFCPQCGARTDVAPPAGPAPHVYAGGVPPPALRPGIVAGAPKSKLVAGLLGIVLGSLGIHRFYLGYTTIGIIQLVLGLGGILTCGITTIAAAVWGLVEGIMILTGSMNRDALGQPLAE
ncbi:MAG TPA: TM2 domain-containing protein [Bryobacteraceae bacterium]|nr:TM2 domain-containing protein [Bryobacteraceae bacterium]